MKRSYLEYGKPPAKTLSNTSFLARTLAAKLIVTAGPKFGGLTGWDIASRSHKSWTTYIVYDLYSDFN